MLLGTLGKNGFPCLFQTPQSASIPWFVGLSVFKASNGNFFLTLHHPDSISLHLYRLPLPLLRTLVITLFHLTFPTSDNPE